jgi:hypothetical protein
MYRWKAWRDSRSRVAVYFAAALAIGVLCGLSLLTDVRWHEYWVLMEPRVVTGRWDFHLEMTFWGMAPAKDYGEYFAVLAAVILGIMSVGRELSAGTMPFLLTRPCRRSSFVLADWLIGLSTVVIIPGLMVLVMIPCLVAAHAAGPGNAFTTLPGAWAVAAAVYGLTYFCTLLAGHSAKGLILSVAAILTYLWLPTALNEWWHIGTLLAAQEWTLNSFGGWWWWQGARNLQWAPLFFWLALACGFLVASTVVIRKREV